MSGTGAPQARPDDLAPGGRPGSVDSRVALDADQIARACARMVHQILEANRGAENLVLMGIPTGVVLATGRDGDGQWKASGFLLAPRCDHVPRRLRRHPPCQWAHHLPVDVDGSTVVLVDDVLYSGRTVRAALDALGDLGRPRAVQLAVLVDRGHRELPIHADHVGKYIPTRTGEHVSVRLAEIDGIDQVGIEQSSDPVRGET